MQNTKLYLIDEGEEIIEKSDINFAPVIKFSWTIESLEKDYPFLSTIDPYGNTYLNVHQATRVAAELKQLLEEQNVSGVAEIIGQTINFLSKVEQHTFAKFVGD